MTGEAIPDALDALCDLWSGLAIAGLQVIDGPPWDVSGDFLAVGWDRSDSPSVSMTSTPFTAGMGRGREGFDVSNLLSLWLGDEATSIRVVRRQLFTTYKALTSALTTDRTLGGAVMSAWPSDLDMTPDINEAGQYVDLRFTVHCDAVN